MAKRTTFILAQGKRRRRFWIVIHPAGGPHPVGFSFWRHYAIKRFLADRNQLGAGMTWRQARRDGFRVVPVYLKIARK